MASRSVVAHAREFLTQPGSSPLTEALFLRLLGLIYLAAFGSLWPQIVGLVGARGIEPAAQVMAAMRNDLGSRVFWEVPSLFWLGTSDKSLVVCCVIGCFFAIFLTAGVFSRVSAIVCWVLYLSLVSVAQPFTSFQWDALLLEAGFLAIFSGAAWLIWGYRLLLFRLMFESGVVKLASHDPNWRNFHALRFHFLTQPLPNPLAYYLYRAPTWLLDFMTAATLAIELVAPFLFFGPRRVRQIGVGFLMLLQLLILLTGNYAFFNLLSLALCLCGLDDRTFAPLTTLLRRTWPKPPHLSAGILTVLRATGNLVIAFLIAMGLNQVFMMFAPQSDLLHAPMTVMAPFQMVNTYGLFAAMTTTRPEIVIEGSNDQTTWREYSFRYKPGELHRGLPLVAPHQPRLDWQMWFAALGNVQENSWVGNLMYRLLVGEPSVERLLEPAPFPKPPRYLRAVLYEYDFTTPAERARTGAVWTRQFEGVWFGPVSLTGY